MPKILRSISVKKTMKLTKGKIADLLNEPGCEHNHKKGEEGKNYVYAPYKESCRALWMDLFMWRNNNSCCLLGSYCALGQEGAER